MAKENKWENLQTRVEKLAERYHEKPIIPVYAPRLSDLPLAAPAWSKFYRLTEALRHARNGSLELRVFAVEPESQLSVGKREFIVSSYEEFWFYYSKIKTGCKHFYEVIEEGVVCHLYFDVEFCRKFNSDLDGEKLVDRLILLTCKKLKSDFNIVCTEKNVLRLDSSNETKFSQHLIFHIPGAVFPNNFEIGFFVRKLCSDAREELKVKAEENQEECIVDQGVYTKNRNFRLFQSTKKGKSSALMRSKHCVFDLGHTDIRTACCTYHAAVAAKKHSKQRKSPGTKIDERVFYASLITNVKFSDNLRVLTVSGKDIPKPLSVHRENTRLPAVCSDEGVAGSTSPYPELHTFVMSLVKTGEAAGYISKWTYFPCSHMLIYSILGSRYCHNIGRQHKSNHIFYVADLSTKVCYQKCHDPRCHGYRSPPSPFPKEVLESLESVDLDVTDDELLDFVITMEENNNDVGIKEGENWGNVTDEDLLEAVEMG